ncbi:hypothetical protein AVEN_102296-1 [Araneus ventricosus]|uniref:Uncharacterized protein n=1 Tax=Araneus ventricosus TaxID=182803 RepID=A0A4Y2IFK4_ARAVE|nr:hypothetical protein AVEN_102296-1 [Araneus ventricosus]
MKSNRAFQASTRACFSNPKLLLSNDSSKAGFWLLAKEEEIRKGDKILDVFSDCFSARLSSKLRVYAKDLLFPQSIASIEKGNGLFYIQMFKLNN